MKKTHQLQTNVIHSLEELKLRIQTKEDVAQALQFVSRIKEFSKEVEDKVKKRSWEIMDEEGIKEIDLSTHKANIIEPTMVEEYKASNLIEGLGIERAKPFLKVNTGQAKKYFEKALREGAITYEEVEKAREKSTTKSKKGYIRLSKKKNENDKH